MGRLKDILYDKSDILLALVILIIAGAIIWNRIDAIMVFSGLDDDTTKSGKASASETKNPKDSSKEAETDDKKADENDSDSEKENNNKNEQATVKGETVRITIDNDDASTTIASKLTDAGLIDSPNHFIKAVKAKDAETKLRSGRFDIEKGSSPEEIVTLLTTTYGV